MALSMVCCKTASMKPLYCTKDATQAALQDTTLVATHISLVWDLLSV